MKYKKFIYKYALLSIFAMLLFFGCSEDVLEETPPHIITAESLFLNVEGFETALNGLYAQVRDDRGGNSQNNLRGEIYLNGTDNMVPNHRDGFARVAEDWPNKNNPTEGTIVAVFNWLYQVINSANTIIGRAEDPDIDWKGGGKTAEENKNYIVAQARVMRAWAYRHLAYLYGDVPITTVEANGANIRTDWVRNPVSEVWQQVKSDLLFGEKYIPVEPNVQGKITKGAVQHYLAELYLVLGKPDSTLYWANQVINEPRYKLITERYGVKADQPGVPFMDMFYDGNSNREEGNTESLWTFQYELETIGGGYSIMRRWHISRYNDIRIDGKTPLELTVERGGRPRARMSLTKYAIDLYEPQDDRASNIALRKFFILKDEEENDTGKADVLPSGYSYGDTIWLNSDNDITYETRNRRDWPYSRKWDWADPLNVNGGKQYNDQVYLRLAETYLLKAEAQFKLGDSPAAAETINIIRRRSNASDISASDVDLNFILDERSRELVTEEQRRYTLLRTGTWLERVQMYNHNGGNLTTERDKLFPIPQEVIDANLTSEMPQNPGF